MNLVLKHEGFENHLIKYEQLLGGVQYVFRFANYYGASVVKHRGSYGHNIDMWELAVIKFENDDNDSWDLNYDTPITSDVVGYLTDDEVRDLLTQIKEL
jgi:hypothetical protein